MKELGARKTNCQEGMLVLAIAVITSVVTLGVLDCLFNRVQCVQVRSDGSQRTLYGLRSCAPPEFR